MKLPTRPALSLALIALVGILGYSNSFQVPFLFDDLTSISENPVITDLGSFLSGAGLAYNARRFVGYLSFALNYRFGGLEPAGYHAVNLAIHLASSFLVYALVRLTLGTPVLVALRPGAGEVGEGRQPLQYVPLFSALLFVCHPIQTQAVTYLVQRLASLAAMFYLLALVLYVAGRLAGPNSAAQTPSGAAGEGGRAPGAVRPYLCYAGALLAALLALATKEIAFTLPLALMLYELCFFGLSRRKKALLGGAALASALFLAAAIAASDRPLGELISDVSDQLRLQTAMSRWDYFLTQCSVIVTYLRLLFLPVGQNLDYDYPIRHSLFQPQVLFPFLLLVSLLALALKLYRSSARGGSAGAESRLICFGILWFFVTLSIESSVIPIEDVIYEHRMYLPALGAFLALSCAGALLARRRPRAVAAAALGFVLLMTGVTWVRNLTWRDGVTFWSDVVAKSPNKARPHLNLGAELENLGRSREAILEFRKALALYPDYRQAYGNLGAALNSVGDFPEAMAVLGEGLRKFPGDPDLLNNLGVSYAAQGRAEIAVGYFEAAVKLAPEVAKYRSNLATARQEAAP